jgi:hypothetical protein
MASFLIEFDTPTGHTTATNVPLTPPVLQLVGWRSIGNPQGGRFINQTGKVLRAAYLKIENATNSFQITPQSGGRLFPTIWVKPDASGGVSEVYFLDGHVLQFGAFWMRVPANTPTEIQDCDTQQACPFSGRVFEQNPPIPQGAGWVQLNTANPLPAGHFANLLAATPSEFRGIDLYGDAPASRHVVFVANGEAFAYDKEQGTVFRPIMPKVGTLPKVNAIAYNEEQKAFVLLQNGAPLLDIKDDSASMRELS